MVVVIVGTTSMGYLGSSYSYFVTLVDTTGLGSYLEGKNLAFFVYNFIIISIINNFFLTI